MITGEEGNYLGEILQLLLCFWVEFTETANKALLKTNHPTPISFPFGGKLARQRGIETHSLGGYDTFLESPPLLDKIYPYPVSQLSRLQKQEQQTPAGTSSNEMNMSQTISDSHMKGAREVCSVII